MIKQNKGITLVALIVTIIILLILAGVSIASLTESGLFEKTRQAEQKSENAQIKEETTLSDYENKIGEYVNGSNRDTIGPNSQNTMSGTEHFTGDYYFNSKPIYEKTIYIASLPNTTTKYYNHGIENVDIIWFDTLNSFVIWSNGWIGTMPFVGYEVSFINLNGASETQFGITTGSDRSSNSAYVTLRYTKTTDTGNGTTIEATPAN